MLRESGATLVDPAPIPNAARLDEPELEVLLYEFKADLDAYLRGLGGSGPRSLAELATIKGVGPAFVTRHGEQVLALVGEGPWE